MQNLFTRNCMQKLNLKSSTIRREKRNFIYISEQLSRALRSSVFRHIREQRYIKLFSLIPLQWNQLKSRVTWSTIIKRRTIESNIRQMLGYVKISRLKLSLLWIRKFSLHTADKKSFSQQHTSRSTLTIAKRRHLIYFINTHNRKWPKVTTCAIYIDKNAVLKYYSQYLSVYQSIY